jgi:alpha-glucosidase
MLALPGGAYVYQGEELGLPEVTDVPDDLRQDPTFIRTAGAEVGRDGCRIPIPWRGSTPPFGFGPSGDSWLPQPADWAVLTVEHQDSDESSMLALYRQALRLRRQQRATGDERLEWLESDPGVLTFRRPGERLICVLNVGAAEAERPGSLSPEVVVLLASNPLPLDGRIPADTAVWYSEP